MIRFNKTGHKLNNGMFISTKTFILAAFTNN